MRQHFDDWAMGLCYKVSEQSTCLRRNIGAIIVRDKQVVSCGFNGAPTGHIHCKICARADVPSGQRSELCRAAHAEQNAIIQAAKFGIALDGSTLYCKMTPCRRCAMIIINSGIKRVVSEKHYHADQDTIELFKLAGVEMVVMNNKVEEYDRQ